MKTPHIIALVVIVASMVVMLFSFTGAVAQHVSISDVKMRKGETVQVPGNIDKSTVKYDATRGELRFDIIGVDPKTRKEIPSQRLTVVYPQPKPENFDTAKGVEAVGVYKDGVFRADNLLVKCPSKYNDEKPSTPRTGVLRTGGKSGPVVAPSSAEYEAYERQVGVAGETAAILQLPGSSFCAEEGCHVQVTDKLGHTVKVLILDGVCRGKLGWTADQYVQ